MANFLHILNRRSHFVVFALVSFIFFSALGVGQKTQDHLRYVDEKDYHQLAEGFLSKSTFIGPQQQPTAYRPPGYPFFLSVVYRIWHRPLAAKVANAFALAICAWLLSVLVGRVVPESKVFSVLILFILTPVSFYPHTPKIQQKYVNYLN